VDGGESGATTMAAEDEQPRRVLTSDGSPDPSSLDVSTEDLRELYRLMALTRRADQEATALQRQGELAVYPPLLGQEAAQVGSAFAMRSADWIFPSYRELGAAVVRGVEPVEYLHFYRATWHGGTYDATKVHFGMVSVPVASQVIHAAGFALGTKLDGADTVSLVYFGDGATSEGDFHEGCNMAAVFKAPVVFFCQNNQWAISVPVSKQTVAPIWKKAEAYGFPGVQVDGNDVLAVYMATREAVERARAHGTPTLIEALTYRLGPHSTADDASRYQPKDQVEEWRSREPVGRYRSWLTETGVGDDSFFAAVEEEAAAFARALRDGVIGSEPRPTDELFAWVFEGDLPSHLARQRDALEEVGGRG
jgi:2-oxoisovalerate dehydrogenase E1 component alpha subunit